MGCQASRSRNITSNDIFLYVCSSSRDITLVLTFSFLYSLKLTSFVIGCKQVPVVIIALILLWGIDLWILDKLRIQFHSPLSIKSPNLTFVFTTGIFLAAHFAFHVKLFSSSAIGLPFASEVAIYYCALLVLYFIPGIPVSIQ